MNDQNTPSGLPPDDPEVVEFIGEELWGDGSDSNVVHVNFSAQPGQSPSKDDAWLFIAAGVTGLALAAWAWTQSSGDE